MHEIYTAQVVRQAREIEAQQVRRVDSRTLRRAKAAQANAVTQGGAARPAARAVRGWRAMLHGPAAAH